MTDTRKEAEAVAEKVRALCPQIETDVEPCSTFYFDAKDDDCAEFFVTVSANDFNVFDPRSSECGRFQVDPQEEYGISGEAADLIRAHNRMRLA